MSSYRSDQEVDPYMKLQYLLFCVWIHVKKMDFFIRY